MNGYKEIASGIIDPGQLSQVDFDLQVRAQRRTPGIFCLGDPWTLEPAREFQPAYLAVFVNPDA